eukprot:3472346-Pyramimonas_sp.AAC.1
MAQRPMAMGHWAVEPFNDFPPWSPWRAQRPMLFRPDSDPGELLYVLAVSGLREAHCCRSPAGQQATVPARIQEGGGAVPCRAPLGHAWQRYRFEYGTVWLGFQGSKNAGSPLLTLLPGKKGCQADELIEKLPELMS